MVNTGNITYHAILVTSDGTQYEITDFIENLGWDEPEGEIASKSSFMVKNDQTSKGYLSDLIKPGCMVVVIVSGERRTQEVARGNVEIWSPSIQNGSENLKCTCYDELYNLQKSQENRIVKKNAKTGTVIGRIFKDWDIPVDEYNGPNVKHKRMVFEKAYLSDEILEILEAAHKLGDEKCLLRASAGKVSVVPYADNSEIFCFDNSNAVALNGKQSTADMITRVKIMDTENKKVKATLNGLVEYGIRQRILTMQQDQSLKDAKKEGQALLDEKGVIDKSLSLQAVDVPYVRKGDVIHVDIGTARGYFDVTGISHDADKYSMTMQLVYSEKNAVLDGKVTRKHKYVVGDIVTFLGGEYRMSAKKNAKWHKAGPGKAKITRIQKKKPYPYKLVHTNDKSTVNGFVTAEQFY